MPMGVSGSEVVNRDPLSLQEAENLGQTLSVKWPAAILP